jgi:hypothetical protein
VVREKVYGGRNIRGMRYIGHFVQHGFDIARERGGGYRTSVVGAEGRDVESAI